MGLEHVTTVSWCASRPCSPASGTNLSPLTLKPPDFSLSIGLTTLFASIHLLPTRRLAYGSGSLGSPPPSPVTPFLSSHWCGATWRIRSSGKRNLATRLSIIEVGHFGYFNGVVMLPHYAVWRQWAWVELSHQFSLSPQPDIAYRRTRLNYNSVIP